MGVDTFYIYSVSVCSKDPEGINCYSVGYSKYIIQGKILQQHVKALSERGINGTEVKECEDMVRSHFIKKQG